MVSRKHVPAVLVVGGVVLLLLSAVPIPGGETSVYVHSVDQPGNDSADQYAEGDVTDYRNLSESGQRVFDRARRGSEYAVENESPPTSDFAYGSDVVRTHPVQYEGEVYLLRTSEEFDAGYVRLQLGQLAAKLLGAALLALGAIVEGWRRIGR